MGNNKHQTTYKQVVATRNAGAVRRRLLKEAAEGPKPNTVIEEMIKAALGEPSNDNADKAAPDVAAAAPDQGGG